MSNPASFHLFAYQNHNMRCTLKDWPAMRRNIVLSIFPMVVFSLLYEIVFFFLNYLLQAAAMHAGGAVFAWLTRNEADMRALITALSMSAAFLPVMRTARSEIRYARYKAADKGKDSEAGSRAASKTRISSLVFPGAVLLSAGLNLLISMTGLGALASEAGAAQLRSSLMMGVLVYGILAPFLEECVFRGITLNRLIAYAGMSVPAATLISSLLFGLYHGNVPQMIYAFLMGYLFCMVYGRTGLFLHPFVLHASCNIVSLFLSYTELYSLLCTPAWCAAFLAAGALLTLFSLRSE